MFIRVDENDRPWLMNSRIEAGMSLENLLREELLTIRGAFISDIKTNSVTEL